MKKLKYILLASVIVLSGCATATKSQNIESMEESSTTVAVEAKSVTEEAAPVEGASTSAMSGDAKIMPPYPVTTLIKSRKPQMKLEEIILKVKRELEISDEYNEVSSSEYTDENGIKIYNISYMNTTTKDSAYVSVNNHGDIYNYGISYGNIDNSGEAISREAALEKAKEILVRLYGSQAAEWETIKNYYSNDLESNSYNLTFQRSFEGIPVTSDRVDMEINKYTSILQNMYVTTGTNYDFSDNSYFDMKEGVKEIEEAFAKYKLENKLYKAFLGTVDYKQSTMFQDLKYIEVYSQFGEQISLDAKTLEPKVLYGPEMGGYGVAESVAMAADRKLTDAEQEMVDNIATQKTVEEAEKKARELFNLDSGYKLTWSNFSNYMGNKDLYNWNLSFSNEKILVNVGLLGSDLELLNYNKTVMDTNYEKNSVTPEEARAVAEGFLSDKAGITLADLEMSPRGNFMNSSSGYNFRYMRSLGDDKYLISSTIDVMVSPNGQEVTNFNKNWDYKFVDREFKATMTSDEAYTKIRDSFGFNLVYKRDGSDEGQKPVKLYYEITTPAYVGYPGSTLAVDANTGKVIDNNGSPVLIASEITYSDIDQSQFADEIIELAENGVGFPGGELKPKDQVKQVDVLRLFYSLLNFGGSPFDMSDEDIYENLKWTGIMGDDNIEPEKIVTNSDVAKYTLRSINLQKVAERNHLYADKYTDSNNTNPDYGYLVIARDMGFIESESDMTLEPGKQLDRETVLHYLYRYIKGRQN